MQNNPLIDWASRHPRIAAWVVLALGMVILLVYEGRDVGLLATQWLALIITTVLVAGACIWIISWEDEAETSDEETASEPDNSSKQTAEEAA